MRARVLHHVGASMSSQVVVAVVICSRFRELVGHVIDAQLELD